MAIRTRQDLLGVDHELDTSELTRTSRLVTALTGYSVQKNKAVVGSNAFAHESGIHQHGVLQDRLTYEIMKSEDVGADGSQIVLGKHSGRHAFRQAVDELAITLTDEEFQAAFQRFKDLADRKGLVSHEDIRAIVIDETHVRSDDEYELASIAVSSATGATPRAHVEIRMSDGSVVAGEAAGDGMVDAACKAIREAIDVADVTLVTYQVAAITEGIDAQGHVNITLRVGDSGPFTGRGVSTDIVEASAQAYLDALNRSRRISQRTQEFRP